MTIIYCTTLWWSVDNVRRPFGKNTQYMFIFASDIFNWESTSPRGCKDISDDHNLVILSMPDNTVGPGGSLHIPGVMGMCHHEGLFLEELPKSERFSLNNAPFYRQKRLRKIYYYGSNIIMYLNRLEGYSCYMYVLWYYMLLQMFVYFK